MNIENDIAVSVLCITYNQVDYIEEAIQSFLMQKTNFYFEILIHDDASTDGTAEIVKKYRDQYPDKIKCVLQSENQYSQGKKMASFLYPLVKGKYIAVCEGDDFWTDENKLQKQFDYMEANPDCSMCVHDGWIVSRDKQMVIPAKLLSNIPTIYGMTDAILGLGIQVFTNSFFYRSKYVLEAQPEFVIVSPTGDYMRVMQMALHGHIYYMPERMSAYRRFAKGSTGERWGKNREIWENIGRKYQLMFKSFDAYTNYEYTETVAQAIRQQWFRIYLFLRDKEKLSEEPYKTMFKKLPFKQKFSFHCPRLFGFLQKIYHFFLSLTSKGKIK